MLGLSGVHKCVLTNCDYDGIILKQFLVQNCTCKMHKNLIFAIISYTCCVICEANLFACSLKSKVLCTLSFFHFAGPLPREKHRRAQAQGPDAAGNVQGETQGRVPKEGQRKEGQAQGQKEDGRVFCRLEMIFLFEIQLYKI